MQTLRLKLRSEFAEREVRAIFDTGSQRSYILKSTAEELEFEVKRRETVVHGLFGGTSAEQHHSCFDIRLLKLDGKYSCSFEVLDQPTICSEMPPVRKGEWMEELNNLNVYISDTGGRGPTEVLIEADVAGRLFIGQQKVLTCGLVALETRLGWTVMGKVL